MKYLIGIVVLLLLTGCGIGGYTTFIPVVREDTKDISVVFCPSDNCTEALSSFILSGSSSVHCAFFDLDLPEIKEALSLQYSNGLDVKLIVDTDHFSDVEDLDIPIKQDERSSFMHNKFCVVDGMKISSGSMNPTLNGAEKNNNNLIFISSSALAQNYEDEFEEMWSGVYGKGEGSLYNTFYLNDTKVESYFCPEEYCGERIKDVLSTAEESIYFMTFSFTHGGIANVLLLKNMQNVTISGIFEKRGAGSQYSKFKVLDYQGADVRKDSNSNTFHHKVFIIDEKIVITGSFNPSKNADTRNDENILIIYDKDVADSYLEEFKYMWEDVTEDKKI